MLGIILHVFCSLKILVKVKVFNTIRVSKACIQIRSNILKGLICIQPVCKFYQQITQAGVDKTADAQARLNISCSRTTNQGLTIIFKLCISKVQLPYIFQRVNNKGIDQAEQMGRLVCTFVVRIKQNEPVHEISNNVVCATSKASDQPVHMGSLIRAFASRVSIL